MILFLVFVSFDELKNKFHKVKTFWSRNLLELLSYDKVRRRTGSIKKILKIYSVTFKLIRMRKNWPLLYLHFGNCGQFLNDHYLKIKVNC